MQENMGRDWAQGLTDKDFDLLKDFFMAAGSLEALSQQYDVTESTVRGCIQALNEKIQENEGEDAFVSLMRRLEKDGSINFETAKILISKYEYEKDQKPESLK